ncbi:MAG: protein kinase [Proteiniphilum sp.]|nr:protein kinase [Proteiniphilum sp.]
MEENSSSDKTARPTGVDAAETLRPTVMDRKKNRVETPHTDRDITKPLLNTDRNIQEFYLNGKRFPVLSLLSQGTGEADVYLIAEDGKKLALKLYHYGIQPPPDHELMDAVSRLAGSGLLVDILDHGKCTHPLTRQERDYELMAYYAGGSLAEMEVKGDEQLLGEIALRCGASIDFLHKHGIIHRDIKPANFLFRDKNHQLEELGLADFGIAIRTTAEGRAKVDYQLRTKIYAAPEYYFSIEGKIELGFKSDYYALGMLLLTLWSGEENFRMNEFELINLKRHGRLPYPADLSPRMLQLVKALTHPDTSRRAGFAEMARWARGEEIYDLSEEDHTQFKIHFNPVRKQTANSPEQLGQIMYEERELGAKYLYSGKITTWLNECQRPDLAVEMEDITENRYPQNKTAGLLAACYFLNPEIPLEDNSDGLSFSTPAEIARQLLDHVKYYGLYLTDPHHALFIFLTARGAANVSDHFAPMFQEYESNRDVVLQMAYTLDPSLPWYVTNEADEKFTCNTTDELLQLAGQFIFSDESWEDLTGEAFLIWTGKRNPALEGRIRSQQGESPDPWCVLYNLNPRVSYDLELDEQSPYYFFTASDMGNYMNIRMEEYIRDPDDDSDHGLQLDMMCDIDGTRLFYYLKSKDLYDEKIDWIRYCADVESKDNQNKYGPYNWRIGIYKAIRGLGFDPFYYFPEQDLYVYEPAELQSLPKKLLQKEIEDGFLADWLTVYYQEDPSLDLSQKYSYEQETVRYLDHLAEIDKNQREVLRYRLTHNEVVIQQQKLKRAYQLHIGWKAFFALFMLVALPMLFYRLISSDISFTLDDRWVRYLPLALGIGVGGYRLIYSFDSFFKVLLIGGGIWFLGSLCIRYGTAYPGYALSLVLLAGFTWVLIKGYIRNNPLQKNLRHLLSPGFEELHLEPLHYAFKAKEDEEFRSSYWDDSFDYTFYLKKGTQKLLLNMIPLILLMLLTGFWVFSPGSVWNTQKNKKSDFPYDQSVGRYEGTFDERPAVLEITAASEAGLQGIMSVRYSSLLTEKVTGIIKPETDSIYLDDLERNGRLDGIYSGTYESGFGSITGIYRNHTTGKEVPFHFTRAGKEELPDSQGE